ncbi:MAG: SAM-dependent methyltransferase [Alphaproteobacteria bacterium]|tara:strand:+ start:788 stop:1816 length:1029 start_codon:yes stop_codon:yes gene_type:complete
MKQIDKYLENNSISLSRFINHCLYMKDYGFYQNNKIGKHFLTAPEVSQLFGECIALFFVVIMKKIKVENFCELGPGNGSLMRDIILTISKFIRKKLAFFLYDKSILLKSIQEKNLTELISNNINIEFVDKLKLCRKPILFICNEFFDALPINQYEKKNGLWYEKKVIFENGYKIIDQKTNKKFSSDFSNGDILETSPLTNLYMKKLCKHIYKFGGGALVFDYGPFKKKRINTLQAICNSKKCGILDFPFESDITYHVDFENLKKISMKYGLYFHGPITQKKFLYFNGINERVISLIAKLKSKDKINSLEKQFEILTSSSKMGDLIKCFFISKTKLELNFFKS